jgi:hypothetical protein
MGTERVSQFVTEDAVGETPTAATGTVALPMESLMIGASDDGGGWFGVEEPNPPVAMPMKRRAPL